MAEMKISNTLVNDTSDKTIAYAEQLKQQIINWAEYNHVTEKLGPNNRPNTQNLLNNLFLRVYEEFLTFLNNADATDQAINTWKEIEAFLAGYTDDKTLASIVAQLNANIESRLNVQLADETGDSTITGMTQKAITDAIDNVAFSSGEKVKEVGIDNNPTVDSDNLVRSGGVQNELALGAIYDVSAKNPTAGSNNDGKFESLSALLSDANLNTLIPTSVRRGGMSIKFVQSSDNKYVSYFLTKDEWSTTPSDWQEKKNKVINLSLIADSYNAASGSLSDGEYYYIRKGSNKGLYMVNGNGKISVPLTKDLVVIHNNQIYTYNGSDLLCSDILNSITFEQGSINTSGVLVDSPNRIRTAEYIEQPISINVPDRYQIYTVLYYDKTTHAFDSIAYNVYNLLWKEDCVTKFVIAKADTNQNISVSEIKGILSLENLKKEIIAEKNRAEEAESALQQGITDVSNTVTTQGNDISTLKKCLIKLSYITDGVASIQPSTGEYFYIRKGTSKGIYKWNGTSADVVSYVDGAIYTYNNQLYTYNGSDLVECVRPLDEILLEQGGINTSGVLVDSTKRIRSVFYMNGARSVQLPSSYKVLMVIYYNPTTFDVDHVEYEKVLLGSGSNAGLLYKFVISNNDTNVDISLTEIKGNRTLEGIYNFILGLNTKVDNIKGYVPLKVSQKGVIDTSGSVGSALPSPNHAQTRYNYEIYPCAKGDKFKIIGTGGNTARLWAFVTSDNKLTDNRCAANYGTHELVDIEAQQDGYLIVQFVKSVESGIYKKEVITTQSLYNRINDGLRKKVLDMPLIPYYSTDNFSGKDLSAPTTAEVYAMYDALMAQYPDYISRTDLGTDAWGNHIYRYDFIPELPYTPDPADYMDDLSAYMNKAILVSGTHPEYIGIYALYYLMESICTNTDNEALEALRWNVHFIVIPVQCPTAVDNGTRTNANGVNIARNFPTGWFLAETTIQGEPNLDYGGSSPLSEKEAKYVYNVLMDNLDAKMCIDIHNHNSTTYTFWVTCRPYDDRALSIANAYLRQTNRFARKKFSYIPSSYEIGFMDQKSPVGSLGNEAAVHGLIGCTWETSSQNITGYTNNNDILTLSHDALANFIYISLSSF